MRLIDADALLTERKKSKYYHLPNGDIAIPIIDVEHAPTVQPDHVADIGKKVSISCAHENDVISRKAAIDAVEKSMYENPHENEIHRGMHDHEHRHFLTILMGLPAAQPEQRWIPVTERLPENDNEVLITVWDAEDDYVEVYKGFYQGHEWWTQWCHGCSKIKDEPCGENIVIAWMPLPEPYRGGDE